MLFRSNWSLILTTRPRSPNYALVYWAGGPRLKRTTMQLHRVEKIEGDAAMKSEKLEVVKGSGNVFRDLGHKNADADQFEAILAAEIIKALDREGLSVRGA